MRITRRSFLLGGASIFALGIPYGRIPATPPLPVFDPAIASATNSIEAISKLVSQRGIIGLDFNDLRTVIQGGGYAVFGEGAATGQDRARVAAELALSDLRRSLSAVRGVDASASV